MEFAQEHGFTTVPNDHLVSKNAKDRYIRWAEDLRKADAYRLAELEHRRAEATKTQAAQPSERGQATPPKTTTAESKARTPTPLAEYEAANSTVPTQQIREHASAILTGTWNEGQPDSPYRSGNSPAPELATATQPSSRSPPQSPQRPGAAPTKHNAISAAFQSRVTQSAAKRPRARKSLSDDPNAHAIRLPAGQAPATPNTHDGPANVDEESDGSVTVPLDDSDAAQEDGDADEQDQQGPRLDEVDMDLITDTVGAIAIDLRGYIAAGSSSGGIGMKHMGRIGPAALVGVGSAVIPEDAADPDLTSVATVTSGTGEHMATTNASAKVTDRLYNGTRRGPGGRNVEEWDERVIMDSFITDDFMDHPGVKNQTSAGAIGVMSVKKDRSGVLFLFAHNTESFALASMGSADREPYCVMSRLNNAPIAHGGRKLRNE